MILNVIHHTPTHHVHRHVTLYDTQCYYIYMYPLPGELDMLFNVQFLHMRKIWIHHFQNCSLHLGAITFALTNIPATTT